MTVTDDVLAVCGLRRAPWPTPERCCAWCGTELPKRSRRWCSQECTDDFTRQHNWQWARAAALARDERRCVRCGHSDDHHRAELDATVTAVMNLAVALTGARMASAAVRSLYAARSQLLRARRLEVNHRTPILGRHGQLGCHHHLDGIETVCRPCHLDITAEQFGHHAERRNPHPTLFDHEGAA